MALSEGESASLPWEGEPELEDVWKAAACLEPVAVRTPLIWSEALDAATDARVLVKAECLQRTGSFKFRGAYNRLSALDPEQRKAGVVAFSSGNHAQGVAAAARLLGIRAVIVMPTDAPAVKIEGVRTSGAQIVFFERATEDREEIARALAESRGAVVVPSFEDPFIIAGQGTVGLELAEQVEARGASVDLLMCGASGGGLIAGIGLVLSERFPEAAIWAVEPEGFDDHRRSLEVGSRVSNRHLSGSICDSLLSPAPGAITFQMNRRRLAGAVSVSDSEVLRAMAFAFRHLKLVVEPGGVVALAAILAGKLDVRGQSVCLVLTGGNVDPALFGQALETA